MKQSEIQQIAYGTKDRNLAVQILLEHRWSQVRIARLFGRTKQCINHIAKREEVALRKYSRDLKDIRFEEVKDESIIRS